MYVIVCLLACVVYVQHATYEIVYSINEEYSESQVQFILDTNMQLGWNKGVMTGDRTGNLIWEQIMEGVGWWGVVL